METQESRSIAEALSRKAEATGRVAESIVSTWREIDVALRPIVGQRGVGLLYKRSIQLASHAYPWLAEMPGASQDSMDLEVLDAVLTGQDGTHAAAAGGLLLKTFHHLLSSLIGPSLTEQLLRPVWVDFSSGPPAQDTTT